MDRRAISPVIAVILLVGIAIGAAALAYSWYMGIQKGTQEVGGEAAGRTALSSAAAMTILNVNDSGYVDIKNIGGVTLTSINCTSNGEKCDGTIESIPPGGTNTSYIKCSLSNGTVNIIQCISAEGAVASYQKAK